MDEPIEHPDAVRIHLREALDCLAQVKEQTGDWRVALEDAFDLVQDVLGRLSEPESSDGPRERAGKDQS